MENTAGEIESQPKMLRQLVKWKKNKEERKIHTLTQNIYSYM